MSDACVHISNHATTSQPIKPYITANGRKAFKSNAGLASFFIFNFCIAPAIVLVSSFLLGLALSLIEGWSLKNGFYFVSQDVTGVGPFFYPDVSELSPAGEIAEILIAIMAITISGSVIGFSSLLSLSTGLPAWMKVVHSPTRGAFTVFVTVPIAVLVFCFALGFVFAEGEGWDLKDVSARPACLTSIFHAPLLP